MSILYTGGFRGCTYKKGLWDKKHYTVTKQKKTKTNPSGCCVETSADNAQMWQADKCFNIV